MAGPTTICKNCGTSLPQNTIFCPNCGSYLQDATNTWTSSAERSVASPPPPPGFEQMPGVSQTPGAQNPYEQTPWTPLANVQHPKQSGQRGLKITGVVFALLLVLGTAGYFTWNFAYKAIAGKNTTGNDPVSRITAPSPSGSAPLSPGANGTIMTTPLHLTIIYADDTLTLVDAQQAQHFADEKTPGDMLRINMKEQTDLKAPYFGSYGYSTGYHVVLPDGSIVQPASIQHSDIPAFSTSRTNWLDFLVPTTTPVDQIVLRLGQPTEHVMDVPLKAGTDLGKYHPRTVTPNKLIRYGNIYWTVKTATWRLSAQGVQADKEMCYVELFLSVASPSVDAYLNQTVTDAFRLTSDGSSTVNSKYNTFDQKISAGDTNKTGVVGFLVPQGSTQYTLVLPPYDRGGVTSTVQQTYDFQIP